jgi:hypothetical protein
MDPLGRAWPTWPKGWPLVGDEGWIYRRIEELAQRGDPEVGLVVHPHFDLVTGAKQIALLKQYEAGLRIWEDRKSALLEPDAYAWARDWWWDPHVLRTYQAIPNGLPSLRRLAKIEASIPAA